MKLTIKLFASFAITTVISVVLLVGLTQWSLQQGFNHFIEQLEGEELTEIENELKNLFIKHGSWQVLNQQPELWRQLGRSSAPANKGPNNKDYNRPPPRNDDYGRPQNRDVRERRPREQNRPSAPPPRNRDAIGRISLYDSGKNVVKGRTEITENPIIHTLQHNGEVIGYLALVPEKSVEQGPDTNFLAEQAMMGLIIGGVVLLFALLVAYLLSRHLLAPIHTLTYGTTRLKAGDYEHEIKSQAANKDELTQLCDDFNELGDTLKHNQQQRQQWASNISHELRTPLTILQTQIEAIIDGIFAPDKKRLLLLQSETARLRRLIDDLYHLSLADSNTLIYQKQSVELLPILQQAVEHYEVKCNNKQIKLQLQPQIISPAYLLADADRLLQLFTNLLENSCRYTDADGEICISLQEQGQTLFIYFEDSKPGVSDNDLPQLFERLFRVEKSRSREHGGSGLGLALCKQIVEQQQGTITSYHSRLGGLGIKIQFPIIKAQ